MCVSFRKQAHQKPWVSEPVEINYFLMFAGRDLIHLLVDKDLGIMTFKIKRFSSKKFLELCPKEEHFHITERECPNASVDKT